MVAMTLINLACVILFYTSPHLTIFEKAMLINLNIGFCMLHCIGYALKLAEDSKEKL
jgi:flagellar biosynthesis protein FliR